MVPLLISENQPIWIGLAVSILIHGLIFVYSGRTFIQKVQFSIQPSGPRVEVSILSSSVIASPKGEAIPESSTASIEITSSLKNVPRSVTGVKKVTRSKSSVELKANPDYYQNPAPEYPELARQMRQEGLVLLEVDVDRQGAPIKVEIIKSSGFRLLDQAAFKAVSHWKFQPGSVGNIPVESTVTVPIRYRLEK